MGRERGRGCGRQGEGEKWSERYFGNKGVCINFGKKMDVEGEALDVALETL